MKYDDVALSTKYQVVIPKAARKKMGLDKAQGQQLQIAKVTENEIVFRKIPSLDQFLGAYSDSFPADATKVLREQRDTDWS